MHSRKERKIFDCFFYHDEEELLELRLKLHDKNVDYFIIVEFAQSFDFRDKKTNLDLENNKFTFFRDRIIHLEIPSIDSFDLVKTIDLNSRYIQDNQIQLSKKNKFIIYGLNKLTDLIFEIKPKILDLFFISDIDELIDFEKIDEIEYNLKYGTVFLKQKNFIWSDKFFLKNNYEGTLALHFSHFLKKRKILIGSYLTKNEKNFTKNIVQSGWHLSHFYDIDKTFKKLNLIYPDLELTKEDVIECFRKLKNPIKNNFQMYENLSENEVPLPFSITNLHVQPLGRPQKKILITWEKNNPENYFYDEIIDFNYGFEDLPKYVLYGDEKYENFKEIYLINESNKKLEKLTLLKKDLIFFNCDELSKKLNLDFGSNKTISFEWGKIKEYIIYDLLIENSILPD